MSSPAMHHYPNAQKEYRPPLIANENAFLGRSSLQILCLSAPNLIKAISSRATKSIPRLPYLQASTASKKEPLSSTRTPTTR